MRPAQSSTGCVERANRCGVDSEFVELAADGGKQRGKDDRLSIRGPRRSQKAICRYVAALRGEDLLSRAVRIRDQQIEDTFVWNSPDEGELLAVRREGDGGVYIAQYLLRVAPEHGHFVERTEELILFGGFAVIDVVAVGRKSEAVEDADGGRKNLHVAAGSNLADHEALHFAVAQDVH